MVLSNTFLSVRRQPNMDRGGARVHDGRNFPNRIAFVVEGDHVEPLLLSSGLVEFGLSCPVPLRHDDATAPLRCTHPSTRHAQ